MSSAAEFYQKGPVVWSFAVIFIIWDCWTDSQFTLDLTHSDVTVMITKSYSHKANHVTRDWEVNNPLVSCHRRAHFPVTIMLYVHVDQQLFLCWKLKEPPKLLITIPLCGKSAGACVSIKTFFPGMEIPIIKIRWSWDHLIFIMGSQ